MLTDHECSENFLIPHFSNVLKLYNTSMAALENQYSKNELQVYKFPNEYIPDGDCYLTVSAFNGTMKA